METPSTQPKPQRSYWKNQAIIRQRIINKQDKTIKDLTASVVQLENDYDTVESELKTLLASARGTVHT